MNFQLKTDNLFALRTQRNYLLGISSVLLCTTLLQSVFLFSKSEKVVVLPPVTQEAFWINGDHVSRTYLRDNALFFAHLLLDVSKENILHNGAILLRSVVPSEKDVFRQRLLDEKKRLGLENLSISFEPVETKVFPKQKTVELRGHVLGYVGAKRVSKELKTFRMGLSTRQGRVFLKSFRAIANKGGKNAA